MKMSTVKQFLRENREKLESNITRANRVVIPWELHASIGIEDIAIISQYAAKIMLDKEYFEHVDVTEANMSCQEQDNIRIVKEFKNIENVCLMIEVLDPGCHNDVYDIVVNDENDWGYDHDRIFTSEFLREAWDYAVCNELALGSLGDAIKKCGHKPEVNNKSFISRYFGCTNTKSARADAAARMAETQD